MLNTVFYFLKISVSVIHGNNEGKGLQEMKDESYLTYSDQEHFFIN